MALTIELPSNIEQQLLKGATQKGISLKNYLVQLLSSATKAQKKTRQRQAAFRNGVTSKNQLRHHAYRSGMADLPSACGSTKSGIID